MGSIQFPRHGKTSKDIQRLGSMAKGPSIRISDLILIQDLGYGATTDMEALLEEVSKLVVAYASAIESNRRAIHKFCNS
jgi:hypothetical protein